MTFLFFFLFLCTFLFYLIMKLFFQLTKTILINYRSLSLDKTSYKTLIWNVSFWTSATFWCHRDALINPLAGIIINPLTSLKLLSTGKNYKAYFSCLAYPPLLFPSDAKLCDSSSGRRGVQHRLVTTKPWEESQHGRSPTWQGPRLPGHHWGRE